MPLRDSYLSTPFAPQAQSFQLPVDPAQPTQSTSQDNMQVIPGIRGWLDRVLLRGGGLRPGRDNDKINSYTAMIQSGQMPDDQVNALKQRNPDAAPMFTQAEMANRQRLMMTQIMQKNFSDPKNPNYEGAIADFNKVGMSDMAQKLTAEWHQARQALQEKAPVTRNRIVGNDYVQEEWRNGQWVEVGKGPRSSLAGSINEMSEDDLRTAAEMYVIRGQQPSLGFNPQIRAKFWREVNKVMKEKDLTPEDVATGQAFYKANSQALGKLEGQKALILTFEKTAYKNAQLALDTSEKVDRTGSPAINRWLLAGKRSLAGDPAVAKFDLAVRTFINEYARVTNSATGGGVTSDAARKEIESALNSAQTKEQVKAVIEQAKQEMENRRVAYEEQEKSLRSSLGQGANKPKAEPAPENNVVDWDTLK